MSVGFPMSPTPGVSATKLIPFERGGGVVACRLHGHEVYLSCLDTAWTALGAPWTWCKACEVPPQFARLKLPTTRLGWAVVDHLFMARRILPETEAPAVKTWRQAARDHRYCAVHPNARHGLPAEHHREKAREIYRGLALGLSKGGAIAASTDR